jgi:predicted  nucleic acid-binding Zn-ribbon protein
MWIWWIISLVVLIACFIFAYKVIVSSYDLMPADKKNFLSLKKTSSSENQNSRPEAIWDLKNKLKRVEENSSFYEIQFSKMQERLKALEAHYQTQATVFKKDDEEDWKEMYYEENEVKEKLENELDKTLQKLEEAEKQLSETEENNTKWSSLQSEHDARLNDLQSMQSNIDLLQRRLEAASVREKELELSLVAEINAKNQYSNLESENARLKSENDILRNQIVEINKKEKALEAGIFRLQELENKVAIYEEEKARMIANLELMVNQNK